MFRVRWIHNGEIIHSWEIQGTDDPTTTLTTSLRGPENGFARGEYGVEVFIGVRPLFDFSFTVE